MSSARTFPPVAGTPGRVATPATPVIELRMTVAGYRRKLRLKLEAANPTGSSKHRTAVSLLNALEAADMLGPGSTVVESSSGNLAVALAVVARERGYGFTAVVDPLTSPQNVAQIGEFGGHVEVASGVDEHGNHLRARLDLVRALVQNKGFVWPNQYGNPANPDAHYAFTAPELWRQTGAECEAVFIPVSTGGTLAGVSRYAREVSPDVRVVAVDVEGSVALEGEPGPRQLTGIGSSRPSELVTASDYDDVIHVSAGSAVSHCRGLAEATGMYLGGSSGAVLAAVHAFLQAVEDVEVTACICPDGGDRYYGTIYSDEWLLRTGVRADPRVARFYEQAEICLVSPGVAKGLAIPSIYGLFPRIAMPPPSEATA
jgi:2,3-diaminopropionate biosynthesis protein SbnA